MRALGPITVMIFGLLACGVGAAGTASTGCGASGQTIVNDTTIALKDVLCLLQVFSIEVQGSISIPQAVIDAADEATALVVLLADVARIQYRLFTDLPWIQTQPLVVQGVLVNMSFNMGAAGAEQFHHMLADVQAGNYEQAAADMGQSLWAKQVGERAERLIEQMRTQQWC